MRFARHDRLTGARIFCAGFAFGVGLLVGGWAIGADETAGAGQRTPDAERAAREAFDHGAEWLLRQQGDDGGWRSTTYGQLRSGVGTTALALYALTRSNEPLSQPRRMQIDRGIEFLLARLEREDPTGDLDEAADHPMYAAALVLLALDRLPEHRWTEEAKRLREKLAESQIMAGQVVAKARQAVGGWNPDGTPPDGGEFAATANISVTSLAVEALAAGRLTKESHVSEASHQRAQREALAFLKECQNFGPRSTGDGGFAFTPDPRDPLNKAGWVELGDGKAHARSYPTATADGIVALVACDVALDDPRTRAAVAWLVERDPFGSAAVSVGLPAGSDQPPDGIDDEAHGNAGDLDDLAYYYYFALARAMAHVPELNSLARRKNLAARIVGQQQADGSWSNPNKRFREDDPLIVTSFALSALSMPGLQEKQ